MYRSYPPPSWAVDLINTERYKELRLRITHAIGRLKAWEHLEISEFKIDGFEAQELSDQVLLVRNQLGMTSKQLVIRRDVNKVRVWRIPDSCKDWKAQAKDVVDRGGVIDHGHLEFNPPKKKAKLEVPDLKTYMKQREEES